ncbi:hypothetical protein F4776DRAFT_618285 [Hypoxylon sp. NC0597]|nr:hypothetical protein F4776DRAFT_618285 [Hypoxylon sp. NC0597]
MVRTDRGIAGEKAAVLNAQKEAGLKLDQEESRKKPSLAVSETSLKATNDTIETKWSPSRLTLFLQTPGKVDIWDGRKPVALPLEIEKYLDMAPIKRGGFMFMSKNYVEKHTNGFESDDDMKATF